MATVSSARCLDWFGAVRKSDPYRANSMTTVTLLSAHGSCVSRETFGTLIPTSRALAPKPFGFG